MEKVLGLDLGTNSIGLSVRDIDKGFNLQDQLDFFTSVIFKSGVGNGKSGEYSYAAERTKKRSLRRLYQARKYRIWNTLAVLIEYGFCPLSKEDLERWSKYDKENGLERKYPVDAIEFERWVRLDFDGDRKADYSSPFQLRAELMEKQFDFSNEVDRFKLGRALYHIAQRRGFKSSKGETIKEQEKAETDNNSETDMDVSVELKKSETKKSNKLVAYMEENHLPTVGCAFALLEKSGNRVRNSEYQAVRSQYKEEINEIFKFQKGLDVNSDFYKHIISENKKEGSIFYKRPLRSQKGLVGKCTLEPNKSRCQISHPEFEKFRAWSFINNIQYRRTVDDVWENLTIEQKQKLYDDKFLRAKTGFKFQEIRIWLEKELNDGVHSVSLLWTKSKDESKINYKDNTNVSGCSISGRLKNLFGDDWENLQCQSSKERINKKTGEIHTVNYSISDIWHVCASFDEAEYVEEFAKKELNFNTDKASQLVRLWGAIPQGYAMLSLKAIKNINRFLLKGLIYSDSVLLAKLPEIFGNRWDENEKTIVDQIDKLISENREQKLYYGIANVLIANYKSLEYEEQFAYKNTEYVLDESDIRDVEKAIVDALGEKSWKKKTEEDQKLIKSNIANLYQQFFATSNRDYFHLPKLADALAKYLHEHYAFLEEKSLVKIYHPSMIDVYAPAKESKLEDGRYLKLLGSPVIGAIKNPMAMRVLHILRKQINTLLINGTIDEDTRMVVETARELNDANMRWAIAEYQKTREKENDEFKKAILEHFPNRNISDDDIDKARLLIDQYEILEQNECKEQTMTKGKKKDIKEKVESFKKDVTKYRLWLEQGCCCIYTGKPINISSLFDDNKVDFEHTIPRSISFDNSLSNLTICDAHYNRTIKKNQIPSQLANYDEILSRIRPWIDKVETLKDNVEFWKGQSKRAQDKDRKDNCIRQRHLWRMELDYWQKKVNAFTMNEVSSGFRSSQLNDTRIITKYAYHYLKTVFSKVEVQNGRYTSDFRKMLGVQSIDEKKSRDKHSHHAIDATLLTLIPASARRDKMLELFYQKMEEKKLNGEAQKFKELTDKLQEEIRKCNFGNISGIDSFIEENILVNHVSKDQTLTQANRRKRVRGKIVPLRDANGNILFEKDENGNYRIDKNGHKIPQAKEWIKGDCIRGQLHGDSFYGAITQWEFDENKKPLRNEDGGIQIGEQKFYVIRRELKFKKNEQDNGFKNWEDIEKIIVDKALFIIMKSQFSEGTCFRDAFEQGIYMIDNKGDRVNKIRHIRCYTTIRNPLQIKKQIYLSNKTYKQSYYAEMGDLYVMCKYENDSKSVKEFRIWSLFDISNNRKHGIDDIPQVLLSKRKEKLKLVQKLNVGEMLLLYKDNVMELREMDMNDLLQRLYVIRGFENDGNRIILKKHINAKQDKELGKGEPVKDYNKMPEKVRCGINTLNFLQQNVEFYISNGMIEFYDRYCL